MARHLFFTGERGVGKSTLLRRLVSARRLRTGGFRTLPFDCEELGRGFHILGSEETIPAIPNQDRIIAFRAEEGHIQRRFMQVFEEAGVRLLASSSRTDLDIIIMDELGFLEDEALRFQQAVFECLDGPLPVWGVIKPLSTPFLDLVRSRPDLRVLTVTADNRDWMHDQLVERGMLCHDEST